MSEKLWVSPAEAARLCGVTRQTIYNQISDGRLPSVSDGPRRRLVPVASLTLPTITTGELRYDLDGVLDAVIADLDLDVLIQLRSAAKALPDKNAALQHVAIAACTLDTARYPAVLEIMRKLQP